MGDGSYAGRRGAHATMNQSGTLSVCCTAKDHDVVEDVSALIDKLFGTTPTRRLLGERKGGEELRLNSQGATAPLMAIGAVTRWGCEERLRRCVCVPEAIWRSPVDVVREFLRGLFESDGYAHPKGTSVRFFSKYEAFVRDVQLLLLGFGVTSRMNLIVKRVKPAKTYTGWELHLSAAEARRFHALIGFVSARKSSIIERKKTGRRARPIVLEDAVVSVKPRGEAITYDITIPPPHIFSANGIAVHNSWEESWTLPKGTLRVFDDGLLGMLDRQLRPGRRFNAESGGLKESIGGLVEVWARPEDGVYYKMGVDPSLGRTFDADWTVIEVIRLDTLEQVAEARFHLDPASDEFTSLVYWLGMAYNGAEINPDITGGWGIALMGELQRRSYPNIWNWRRRDDAHERVSNRLGFLFTKRDKAILVNTAVALVRRGGIVVHSEGLIEELRNFLNIGLDEWGAAPGFKDDRASAWFLALLAARDERVDLPQPSDEDQDLRETVMTIAQQMRHDTDTDLREESDRDNTLALTPWRVL